MKKKLNEIKKFLEENPNSGYYLTSYGIWPFKKYLVGDVYGPMGPGRYLTIDEFYNRYIKKTWKTQ